MPAPVSSTPISWPEALDMALQWPHLPLATRTALLGATSLIYAVPASALDGITLQKLIQLSVLTQHRFTGLLHPSPKMFHLLCVAHELQSVIQDAPTWLPLLPVQTTVPDFLAADPVDWIEQFDLSEDIAEESASDLQMLFLKMGEGPWSISRCTNHLKFPRALISALDLGVRCQLLKLSWDNELGLCITPAQRAIFHTKETNLESFVLKPCKVVEHQASGNLTHNLRELLLLVAETPQKLHQNESRIYAGTIKQLALRLHLPPAWLAKLIRWDCSPVAMVERLTTIGETLGVLKKDWGTSQNDSDYDEDLYLHLGQSGMSFLQSRYLQQQHLLCSMIRHHHKWNRNFLHQFCWTLGAQADIKELDSILNGFLPLLAKLSPGEFYATKDLAQAWFMHTPIRPWFLRHRKSFHASDLHADGQVIRMNMQLLEAFASWANLIGALQIGVDEHGRFAIATTPDTMWWLTGKGDLSIPTLNPAHCILKPDFEIAFLAASPEAESRLALFCERIGKASVGLMFKVNKASVQRAVHIGIPLAHIENTLDLCFLKIPQNVHAEIRGWYTGLEIVQWEKTCILQCQSEEQAQRILRMLPGKASLLHGPILRVIDSDSRKEMERILKKDGIRLK